MEALRQGPVWYVPGTARRPEWLPQREQGKELWCVALSKRARTGPRRPSRHSEGFGFCRKRGGEFFRTNQVENAYLSLCKICSSPLAPVTSNLGSSHSLGVLSRPGLTPCLRLPVGRYISRGLLVSAHIVSRGTVCPLSGLSFQGCFHSEQPWDV